MRVIAAALACAGWISAPAGAATFYYVGGLYDYANLRSGKNPGFSYGTLDVDMSKLPEGQTLEGYTYRWGYDDDGVVRDDRIITVRLDNALGEIINLEANPDPGWMAMNGSFVSFDEKGSPMDWNVEPGFEDMYFYGSNGLGLDRRTSGVENPFSEDDISDFLRERGYQRGTAAFAQLVDEHYWQDGYGQRLHSLTPDENKGRWYTDIIDYTRAVMERTLQSLSFTPTNIYAIKECRYSEADIAPERWRLPA